VTATKVGQLREAYERYFAPLMDAMTPEVAEVIVNLRSDQATQDRLDELAEKNREGQITPEEYAEYDMMVRAGNMISVLQAKAYAFLRARKAS
jgi:hypothetical protein